MLVVLASLGPLAFPAAIKGYGSLQDLVPWENGTPQCNYRPALEPNRLTG